MKVIKEDLELKRQEELLSTTDKKDYGVEIESKNVDETPFTIIKRENEVFGVIGNHRITEIYNTFEECEEELKKINWTRITQVIWAIMEKFRVLDNIEKN